MNKGNIGSRRTRRNHLKNITRFTYDNSGFQGWRLSICRNHVHYTRYFSDREHGGEQGALAAALGEREKIYERMEELPTDSKRVLEEFTANKPMNCRLRGGRAQRKHRNRE